MVPLPSTPKWSEPFDIFHFYSRLDPVIFFIDWYVDGTYLPQVDIHIAVKLEKSIEKANGKLKERRGKGFQVQNQRIRTRLHSILIKPGTQRGWACHAKLALQIDSTNIWEINITLWPWWPWYTLHHWSLLSTSLSSSSFSALNVFFLFFVFI